MTTFSLEELCDAVNERLSDLELRAADGRTNPQVTARNVRFYQSKSLLSPVGRAGGRAAYTETHVEEIVAIKRAQADGLTLDQIASRQGVGASTPTATESAPLDLASLVTHRMVEPSMLATERAAFAIQEMAIRTPSRPVVALRFADLIPQEPRRAAGLAEVSVPVMGWFLDLPSGRRLSGPGVPPNAETIDQITRLLASEPSGDDD